MIRVFINGFSTGMFLQLAVGPVFFLVLQITLQRTPLDGFCSVAAVTMVDYFYIFLAVAGAGKIIDKSVAVPVFRLIGVAVLLIFGIIMLVSAMSMAPESFFLQPVPDYRSSFFSAFFLTIASPMTIVFWTGLFAAKAVEHGYTKHMLMIFALSAGFATCFFLGGSVLIISIFKVSIPFPVVKILNVSVGVAVLLYGAGRAMVVSGRWKQGRLG
ncbi:MAG: LysE family transporter [Chlorobiaceae bacterium]|nr:LysE family transporter [Chlorobiaceae bacterium]